MEEDAEVKGLVQGHVAREKSGSRACTPSTVPHGTNPVEKPELHKGRNGVVFLSPCHPKAKTRLLPQETGMIAGPHEAGQWPYRCYHTPDLPLDWRSLVLHGKQKQIPAPALPGILLCALGKPLNLSEPQFQ